MINEIDQGILGTAHLFAIRKARHFQFLRLLKTQLRHKAQTSRETMIWGTVAPEASVYEYERKRTVIYAFIKQAPLKVIIKWTKKYFFWN